MKHIQKKLGKHQNHAYIYSSIFTIAKVLVQLISKQGNKGTLTEQELLTFAEDRFLQPKMRANLVG